MTHDTSASRLVASPVVLDRVARVPGRILHCVPGRLRRTPGPNAYSGPVKLNQRAAAGRATTSGAAEAVAANGNGSIFQMLRIDIPKEERTTICPPHPELLIEVAIIDLATPANT